jgi:hypothetical protein
MLMINGAFRGIASGAAAGGGGGGGLPTVLLSLDAGNSGNPAYEYLNFTAVYEGCFGFPSPLDANGWHYNDYNPSCIDLSPVSGRAIVSCRNDSGSLSPRIAEIQIPTLYSGSTRASIPSATVTRALFDAVAAAPSNNDIWAGGPRIQGIKCVGDKVVVNAYGDYDLGGSGSVTQTTMVLDNSSGPSPTGARGWYEFVRAPGDYLGARISGWIAEIPAEFQSELGGTHLMGGSSGNLKSGNSRHSMGPSFYVVTLTGEASITGASPPANGSEIIVNDELMNFPLGETTSLTPESELNNWTGSSIITTDPLWTNLSECYFAFIVPNTDTYIAFGYSGGHANGIYYLGSYRPFNEEDIYNRYWCFKVSDLLRVKSGEILPHQVRPYETGTLPLHFDGTLNGILGRTVRGGTYDPTTKKLYITTSRNDAEQASALCEVYDLSGVAA